MSMKTNGTGGGTTLGVLMDTFSSYAFTVSAFVYSTSGDPLAGGTGVVVSKRYSATTNTAFRLNLNGGPGFWLTSGSGDAKAFQSWGGSAGNWYHIYGTRSGTSVLTGIRQPNGTAGTDSETSTTAYVNGTNIAVTCGDTANNNATLPGTISFGEIAIWKVVLSAQELTAVGSGVSPNMIRPTELLCYYPHYGSLTKETNLSPSSSREGTIMQERFGGSWVADTFHAPASRW